MTTTAPAPFTAVGFITGLSKVHFNSFTVEYANLSRFASVIFIPNGVKRPTRRNSVVVGKPVALIARKDGDFTIRASRKEETRKVSLRNGILRTTDYDGVVHDLMV